MDMDKVILTDEELKEVTGGTHTSMITESTCNAIANPEECEKAIGCQWADNKCVFTAR